MQQQFNSGTSTNTGFLYTEEIEFIYDNNRFVATDKERERERERRNKKQFFSCSFFSSLSRCRIIVP